MQNTTDLILEIIKYTLPSLIVFLTAYLLMKQYLTHQSRMAAMQLQDKDENRLKTLKIQAYERLTIFMDRIMPYHLFLRLNATEMTAKDLQHSMLVTIQQEFEYNLTQQLYVSHNLWEIIKLAKDQTASIITQCGEKSYNTEDSKALMERINKVLNELKASPSDQAKAAIRKEMELVV